MQEVLELISADRMDRALELLAKDGRWLPVALTTNVPAGSRFRLMSRSPVPVHDRSNRCEPLTGATTVTERHFVPATFTEPLATVAV